jgi:hypothetical protein
MTQNPLQNYFRKPSVYVSLPTQGRWYRNEDITLSASNELAIYGMTARDDVLLNTPDAMLNGEALKKVILNCVPDIHNVDALMMPDLETIFVGLKLASGPGVVEINRSCPKCGTDCNFDLQCQPIIDTQTMIEPHDGICEIDGKLRVFVKPYNFRQRGIFIQREFEEEKTLRSFDAANPDSNEFLRAQIMAEAVDRISSLSFQLVAASIDYIQVIETGEIVNDGYALTEWLMNITSDQAEQVIHAVDLLNKCGPNKELTMECANCNHQWQDGVAYDPISFFVKRS